MRLHDLRRLIPYNPTGNTQNRHRGHNYHWATACCMSLAQRPPNNVDGERSGATPFAGTARGTTGYPECLCVGKHYIVSPRLGATQLWTSIMSSETGPATH